MKKDQPAFPLVYDGEKADPFCNSGMSLRDYFAAKAIQKGMERHPEIPLNAAMYAYAMADAMLTAREKPTE